MRHLGRNCGHYRYDAAVLVVVDIGNMELGQA
jgi:hypothetical protein